MHELEHKVEILALKVTSTVKEAAVGAPQADGLDVSERLRGLVVNEPRRCGPS
jgi:hypothetical protein